MKVERQKWSLEDEVHSLKQQLTESEAKCKLLWQENQGWAREAEAERVRVAKWARRAALWKELARRLRQSALYASRLQSKTWDELQACKAERDAWVDRCDRLKRELKEAQDKLVDIHALRMERDNAESEAKAEKTKRAWAEKERDALKLALERALVANGAGSSPYARSQPSDACEIEMWKARVDLDDRSEALLSEVRKKAHQGLMLRSFNACRSALLEIEQLLATPDAERENG